jgi:anaerobic selenocysteine-containing dehydrogenase
MSSYFNQAQNGIVYNKQIIAPQGEARDMNWFRMQVANALGQGAAYAATYFPGMQNTTYDQWNTAMENWLEGNYATWLSSQYVAAGLPNPPTWSQLQTNGLLRNDCYPPTPPTLPKANSITFYDAALETFDTSKVQEFGYFGIGAAIPPMAIWQYPAEGYNDPNAANYPLVMRDTHGRFTTITQGWADPMLNGEVYRHSVWMNPADASARGIVDGDIVDVYNDRGTIELPAYVTSRQTPGSVFVYHAATWAPDAQGVDQVGCSNVLSNDNILVAQGGQEATNALVEVCLA